MGLKEIRDALGKDKKMCHVLIAVMVLGLALQAFLFSRVWVGGDQVGLMRVGIRFAEERTLKPTSKKMSGGGRIPGGMLQILLGAPLIVVPHYKAPIVVISLLHILSVLFLAEVMFKTMGLRFMVAFMSLYWLSPWRLYHGSIMWEPSYFYFFSAVHLWACFKLSTRPTLLPSLLLGVLGAVTPQVHGQFLILWLASFFLFAKKLIKVHYVAVVIGLLIGGLTLIPMALEAKAGATTGVAPKHSYIGRSLVKMYPPLKTLVYWARFSSMDVGRVLTKTIFFSDAWADRTSANSAISLIARVLNWMALASIGLGFLASFLYFHQFFRKEHREAEGKESGDGGMKWLAWYCLVMLISMFVASCLSPVTMQSWHMVIGLPAACVPVAFLIERYWNNRRKVCRAIFIAFIVLRIPIAGLIGTGHVWFRRGLPGMTVEQFNNEMPEKYRVKSDE